MSKWLAWLFLLFPVVVFAGSAKLTAIQFVETSQGARLIMTANQPVKPRVFVLANPTRLILDFPETGLSTSLNRLFVPAGVKSIRSGHPTSATLRIVIDLFTTGRFQVISSGANGRVVLDIFTKTKTLPPVKVTQTLPPKRFFTVVVDAGHGGKDPGAVGMRGTQEKNITLAIARTLAYLINQEPNTRAVLTRDGDYYVGLRDRLKLARKGKADLFIAIHADSYFNDRAGGASVYTLSQHGATSEAARWLARRDNYSELGGVDLRDLSDQSYLLRSVLIDLAQTATITDSLRLGAVVLNSLSDITSLHYSRVEQAPFMVLKSPDIPSILVETGFISNEHEEIKLRDPDYQRQAAEAMLRGVKQYIKKYAVNYA